MQSNERKNIYTFRINRDISGLEDMLKNTVDSCTRNEIVKILGRMRSSGSVSLLLECYSEYKYLKYHRYCGYSNLHVETRDALILIGEPGVETLINSLEWEGYEVPSLSAEVLGEIGDPRAVEPLINAMKTSGTVVRQRAAQALGLIGDPTAVEPLIEALDTFDYDFNVEAIKALGLIGDPRAIEPLEKLVEHDNLGGLAKKAIITINDPSAKKIRNQKVKLHSTARKVLEDPHDTYAVKQLIAFLNHTNRHIQKIAMRTLFKVGPPATGPISKTVHPGFLFASFFKMLEIVTAQSIVFPCKLMTGYLKPEAFELLGYTGPPGVEPLIRALHHMDNDVKHYAIGALGETGDPGAVEPLIASLKSRNWVLVESAACALGNIGDERAVEPLISKLDHRNSVVRNAVAYSLGQIGDPAAVAPLIRMLRDKEEQNSAAVALTYIGQPAIEPLIEALKDENEDTRRLAIRCLGTIGDPRVIEPMLEAARDKTQKKYVAEAFRSLRNPDDAQPLIQALMKEKKKGMRKLIANALGIIWVPQEDKLGAIYWIAAGEYDRCAYIGEPAVELLIPVLKDKNPRTRITVANGLGRIGDPRAIKPLVSVLDDKDEYVSRAALKALDKLGWEPESEDHLILLANYRRDEKGSKPDIENGSCQLYQGISCLLENNNLQKANQFFQMAAENCTMSDAYMKDQIMAENYDSIALGHLWHGYALLNLGRYDEANEHLREVIPYLNRYKILGIEMWRKIEYALPYALVPLCDYKLEPSQQNLKDAQDGIKKYLNSIQDEKYLQQGILYYDHLKRVFANVYDTKISQVTEPATPPIVLKKPDDIGKILPGYHDTIGSVIIFDIKGGSLEIFGSNNELEEYVDKMKALHEFPVLSGLMELYAMEGQQQPEPLINECQMLLARKDMKQDIIEKTKALLSVAKDAQKIHSTVMLYFDPEV